MNPLSLHHLTIKEVSPSDLVTIAAQVGCDRIGVFVRGPTRSNHGFALIEDEPTRQDVKRRLAATGVKVHNLEVFALTPKTQVKDFLAALETGAAIGAERLTAQVHDPDEARAGDHFLALCELAAPLDLKVHIEFTAFSVMNSIEKTAAFLSRYRHRNGGLAVDCLHLHRTGGSPKSLAGIDPALITYAQICDGPLAAPPGDPLVEAVEERGVPGTGQFDLRGFVDAIPEAVTIDVEVPSKSLRDRGMSALERSRITVDAARRIVARNS